VDGDEDAVAAAVRRYAEDLPDFDAGDARARVSMESGLSRAEDGETGLLVVGEEGFAADGGDLTALVAAGDIDTRALAVALERLHVAGIEPEAAGVADSLVVVVSRREGADALRLLEDALSAVPEGSQ